MTVDLAELEIRLKIKKHFNFLCKKNMKFVFFKSLSPHEWDYFIESEDFNIHTYGYPRGFHFNLVPTLESDWIDNPKYEVALDFFIGYVLNDIEYVCFEDNIYKMDDRFEAISTELQKHYSALSDLLKKENFLQQKSEIEDYLSERIKKELPGFPIERIHL